MKEVALSLAAMSAFSLLMVVLFKQARSLEVVAALMCATFGGYMWLGIFILRRLWRLAAARVRPSWLCVPVQAGCFALLFSPTFAACGALAPLPFPLIIAVDVVYPPENCGNLSELTRFNTLYVVVPTWLVFTLGYSLYLLWSRRHAL
jgi:hypothetical protein